MSMCLAQLSETSCFFYGLYEFQDSANEFTSRGTPTNRIEREQADDFYGVNLLWYVTDNHSLSLTHFTDEREIISDTYDNYDPDAARHDGLTGPPLLLIFGVATTPFSATTGSGLTTSPCRALYGKNEYSLTSQSDKDNTCPNVVNSNDNVDLPFIAGCAGDFLFVEEGGDEREAYRLDFEWTLGTHNVRFGFDHEVNTSALASRYPAGNHYYRYYQRDVGTMLGASGNQMAVPDVNGGWFTSGRDSLSQLQSGWFV